MDPSSIIATAVAAGLVATADPAADPEMRRTYELLEILLRGRYRIVDLRQIWSKPSSRAKRESLAEDLQDAGAGDDAEILEAARQLLHLVHNRAPETGAAIGVDLERVVVAALRIGEVESGVRIRDSEFEGEIEIGSVRAGSRGSASAAPEETDATEDRPPIFHGVPPRPALLVGRDQAVGEVVERLLRRLQGEDGPSVAISGAGGVGKTALAASIAHDRGVQARFRDGILWGAAGKGAKVHDILTAWGWPVGLQTTSAELDHQAQLIRNAVGRRSILFILDDVWDVETARRLRCGGPNCAYLLTTRDGAVAHEFAGPGSVVNVEALAVDAAVELLRSMAPQVLAAAPDAVRLMVLAAGGVPLALQVLGRYLGVAEQNALAGLATAVLRDLSDPERLVERARELTGAAGGPPTLEQTISLSLDGLDPEVVQAFYCLGAFAPHPETFGVAAALQVADTEMSHLDVLLRRSLVQSAPGERLSLHPALAEYARVRMPGEAVVRQRAMYGRLLGSGADWQGVETAYPQIRHVWTQWNDDVKGKIRFALLAQDFQRLRGLWKDRISWAEEALDLVRRTGWEDDSAALLTVLGEAHEDVGEWNEALDYYEAVREFKEQTRDRTSVADTLDRIGRVQNARGRREDALVQLERALSFRYGLTDQHGTAVTLACMGQVYQALGQFASARKHLDQALAVFEETGDRRRTAETLNSIGNVYYGQGGLDQAQDHYDRALFIWEVVGDLRGQAATLNNLGSVQRDPGIAIRYYERALPIREEVGDRQGMAVTLVNLGLAFHAMEQRERAAEHFGRAVSLLEALEDRQGLWLALTNLGLVQNLLGQRQQAIESYLHALPIGQELEDWPRLAAMLNDLGAIYTELGEWDEALKHYRHAQAIKEDEYLRAGLATTLKNLGALHQTLGQTREAEKFYDQARWFEDDAETQVAAP